MGMPATTRRRVPPAPGPRERSRPRAPETGGLSRRQSPTQDRGAADHHADRGTEQDAPPREDRAG